MEKIRIACLNLFIRYVYFKTGKAPQELTKNELKTHAALLVAQCEYVIRDIYGLDD